jgi:hypothetical protein
VAFISVGIGILVNHEAPDAGNFLLHTYLPDPIRAALWIIPGVAALFAATHRGTGKDGYGFAALVVPVIVRFASYVWATVAFLVGAGTWPHGWVYALIWAGLLSIILIIAGWPEVPPPPREKRPRRRQRKRGPDAIL